MRTHDDDGDTNDSDSGEASAANYGFLQWFFLFSLSFSCVLEEQVVLILHRKTWETTTQTAATRLMLATMTLCGGGIVYYNLSVERFLCEKEGSRASHEARVEADFTQTR